MKFTRPGRREDRGGHFEFQSPLAKSDHKKNARAGKRGHFHFQRFRGFDCALLSLERGRRQNQTSPFWALTAYHG
jgi:hypothetical protein